MPRRPTAASALLLALVAPYAAGQAPPPPPPPSTDLRYTGASVRLGVGYDSENHLRGDAYWVFREDERSAWITEGWIARDSAGGAKLSFHWLPEGGPPAEGVRKAFAAIDQNATRDRKVTVGGGYENERYSLAAYGAAGVTGRRNVSSSSTSTSETVTGTDAIGQFEQVVTTTVSRTTFERAYDWGLGVRAGHFYERGLVRVDLGADYEWGRGSTSQATLSLGVEKYFDGSPWSIAVLGEVYRKHGGDEVDRDDQRGWVMLRYEFGGPAWRPAKRYRDVRVEVPATAPAAAVAPVPAEPPRAETRTRVEKRLVKTTATASSDALFDLDRAELKPDARKALDAVITQLATGAFEGNVRVTGHTCDLASDAYNLKLSQRRAAAVRDYLVAGGVPADRIVAEGMGKRAPRYPNDAQGRPKNRRVDVEFVTLVERVDEVPVAEPAPTAPSRAASTPAPAAPAAPAVEWRREEIETEPAWLRRALHDPVRHKQAVDVYRTTETSTTVATGAKHYVNLPPRAVADAYTVPQNAAPQPLAVLANDIDPDGDALTVVSTTAPAHGTVAIAGAGVTYQPAVGYVGTDTFSYTVRDAGGLTSTATVTLTVVAAPEGNRPPVATADAFGVSADGPAARLDVLANDTDPDGDAIRVIATGKSLHGTVSARPDGVVYQPAPGYVGTDTFAYTISDGRGLTATATVMVSVTGGTAGGNHAPYARDDYAIAGFNTPVTIAVLANDGDPDGDAIVVESYTQPENGTVTRGPGNTLVYLSKRDYVGYDRFVYTVSDGKGGRATANVLVNADP